MSNSHPTVSVIIISYNTAQMTLDCLRSVKETADQVPMDIWVVDNASTDGSPAAIRAKYPGVKLLENTVNAGFGAANNQAMALAKGDYFLLLNSDAFPKAGAIDALVDFLREHPRTGAVGARLLNADGSLQRSCWRFPTPCRAWLENLGIVRIMRTHPVIGDYYQWDHRTRRDVDFVIGACMLVRREAYEQVGGFDEGFFLYAEESDWQLRMHNQGWAISFDPRAEVVHLGGASGASNSSTIRRYFFDGLDRFTRKHFGLAGLISTRLAMALGSMFRTIAYGAMLLLPNRRATAWQKTQLHWWLMVRQLTCWHRALLRNC